MLTQSECLLFTVFCLPFTVYCFLSCLMFLYFLKSHAAAVKMLAQSEHLLVYGIFLLLNICKLDSHTDAQKMLTQSDILVADC